MPIRRLPLFSLLLVLLLVLLPACGSPTATEPQATSAPAAEATSAPAATTTDAPTTAAATTAAATAAPTTAATSATAAPAAAASEPLQLIATYSILGDLVQNVVGDTATVRTLVGPDGDPHVYEPTPADSAALLEADLIFENGLEFETWIDDLYNASGSQAERVVVTQNITPLPASEGHEHGHDEHGHDEHGHDEHGHDEHGHAEETVGAAAATTAATEEHGHDEHGHDEHGHDEGGHSHGEYDPHVWNDPNNAMAMVEVIRDALVAADSANAATYEANAEAYLAELRELDAFVQQQVATLPAERRKLVTTHDTFSYFADRYGFEVVGTALGSVSTEVADPSAGEIAALVGEIQAVGVPAIFAESSNNPQLMERIAEEAGVQLAPPLFPEALSPPDGPAATYLDLVRHNVQTIVTALAG